MVSASLLPIFILFIDLMICLLTYLFIYNNNNELYVNDHTNTYSIAKAMFRNQNYNTGQLRYFDNNLSRTSKQAEIYFMTCILIK